MARSMIDLAPLVESVAKLVFFPSLFRLWAGSDVGALGAVATMGLRRVPLEVRAKAGGVGAEAAAVCRREGNRNFSQAFKKAFVVTAPLDLEAMDW